MLIFRPWRTTKDGKRIYAKAYGKKAFPIWVDDESENEPQKDSDKDEEQLRFKRWCLPRCHR